MWGEQNYFYVTMGNAYIRQGQWFKLWGYSCDPRAWVEELHRGLVKKIILLNYKSYKATPVFKKLKISLQQIHEAVIFVVLSQR